MEVCEEGAYVVVDGDNGAVVDYPISVQHREVEGYEGCWECTVLLFFRGRW